jgi:hypothetical protein
MEKLVPSKAKGTHVFRSSQALTTGIDREDSPVGADGRGSPVWDIEKDLGLGGNDGNEDDEEEKEDEEKDESSSSVRPYSSLLFFFFFGSF